MFRLTNIYAATVYCNQVNTRMCRVKSLVRTGIYTSVISLMVQIRTSKRTGIGEQNMLFCSHPVFCSSIQPTQFIPRRFALTERYLKVGLYLNEHTKLELTARILHEQQFRFIAI